MSMQLDFMHPRQLEDMQAARTAIKSFSTAMNKMMLLMKDLGMTLEQVSHSFDALTSLSFTDDAVKAYVRRFAKEVTHMKEGVAFRNYNKLVHEEVLLPVETLKNTLKEAEKAAKTEKKALARYQKAKQCVDKQEKSFAKNCKPLDESKSYIAHLSDRDSRLSLFEKSKADFEERFVTLVGRVEMVTTTSLKRYLDLNAGYMSAVVDALTNADPTVMEAIALYRREGSSGRSGASPKGSCSPSALAPGASPALPPASAGRQVGQNEGAPTESSRATTSGQQHPNGEGILQPSPSPPVPVQAPLGAAMPISGPPAAAVEQVASQAHDAGPRPTPALPPPLYRMAGQETYRATVTAVPPPEEVVEEDFGSVSQVGTSGWEVPPLYNFSRGPASQVSSVRPRAGYVDACDEALTREFLTKMEGLSRVGYGSAPVSSTIRERR